MVVRAHKARNTIMTTDTIGDMLTRVRNAVMRKKSTVEMPYSKLNYRIASVMKDYGFVKEVRQFKEKDSSFNSMAIDLAYDEFGQSKIDSLDRVSRPGLRIYKKSKELGYVRGGMGMFIVSTPQGVMAGTEARKRKLGGEIICKVY